jgi:malate dehydrogenase (oxaloacetate-decarboxylating)
MCVNANDEQVEGGIREAATGADILIAASRPGPGTISPDDIRVMADDAIVFATANPIPEIWPWEAQEAGARIVATGRSDFPNQINNSLGFPGIFRGALDVQAYTITDDMCIAAANAIAGMAEEKGLSPEYIVPTMDEWEVFPREAVAVGRQAVREGVARQKRSRQELYAHAEKIIARARDETQHLMKHNFIPAPPEE